MSSFVVDELRKVIHRKFEGKEDVVDTLVSQLPYELVDMPEQPEPGLFKILDDKDYPILYSAITEDVDVFITGDRDFDGLGLKKPEIISPAEFLQKY